MKTSTKEYTVIFQGGISREYIFAETPEEALHKGQDIDEVIMILDEDGDCVYVK